ncbi:hypothetical protein ACE1SV_06240 [Streptomyces sp. E-15]
MPRGREHAHDQARDQAGDRGAEAGLSPAGRVPACGIALPPGTTGTANPRAAVTPAAAPPERARRSAAVVTEQVRDRATCRRPRCSDYYLRSCVPMRLPWSDGTPN